jgi:hypothetical protein
MGTPFAVFLTASIVILAVLGPLHAARVRVGQRTTQRSIACGSCFVSFAVILLIFLSFTLPQLPYQSRRAHPIVSFMPSASGMRGRSLAALVRRWPPGIATSLQTSPCRFVGRWNSA